MIRMTYVDDVSGGPRPGTFTKLTTGLVADAVSGEPLYVTSFPPTVEVAPPWPGPEPTLGPE